MERLIIMDYNSSSVDIFTLTKREEEGNMMPEDILKSRGYNPDECSFMFCESLKININV